MWESRLAKDTNNYDTQSQLVITLEEQIDDLKDDQDELLEDKRHSKESFD